LLRLLELEMAKLDCQPGVFSTKQGSQFTSATYAQRPEAAGILMSTDSRSRMYDNILVERLWRTLEVEEMYLKDYDDMNQARENLDQYFVFYNWERVHQNLG
jgi:putative transposase